MYVLLLIPVALVVGAAISLPAYQQYVFRVQVREGAMYAEKLMNAANAYYARYGEMPDSNAVLGLKPGTELSGRFVSDARMRQGRVVVSYNHLATVEWLRDKVLVLTPQRQGGQLTWDCTGNSTLPEALLPAQCFE
jgi:Tfp pilus assembly major pilin PilA